MNRHHHETPDRAASLSALTRASLDVLVIGGGIVGAGVARDAALRGLRVGLIEQSDFASGTSSRSSRLLHGGLRYLAQGRIGLVRQASVEKRIIHRIAPHLASPLAFLFPTYRRGLGNPWARWKLRLGVKVYDLLCGGGNLGLSGAYTPAELRKILPGINAENLTGGIRYFDAFTNDARLVLDTLRSAARAGAVVVNYGRFESATPSASAWACVIRDRIDHQTHDVNAACVVNAAGPWAQQIPHSSARLRLTKGVHLVIDRRRLDIPDAVVMTDGERILFAIPWGQRVILGTTDTDYDGRPEDVGTLPEDVDYILGVMRRSFPPSYLCREDIISTWAGVRPLIADASGGPSDISRSHQIRTPRSGWWDVMGGKLTTYRLMAQETVNAVEKHLGRPRSKCVTATVPLLPFEETHEVSALLPPAATQRIVEHFCRREWARHLDDVMIRRTSWHYYRRDAHRLAVQVSRWMASSLRWSEDVRLRELDAYTQSRDREGADCGETTCEGANPEETGTTPLRPRL